MSGDFMPFGEFVEIQPHVSLEKGKEYDFVAMEDIQPHQRMIEKSSRRIWSGGGGARFQNGDTVFARITPCLENGKTALISSLESGIGFGSTEFYVFRAKPNVSDARYIYYLARSEIVREPAIKSMVGSSGRQRVKQEALENISVPRTATSVQSEIAEVLAAYDDLIECNRRRIALLEEAARLLYREWFVHFRFPGHGHAEFIDGLPEGWQRRTFGEIAELKYGKALKAQDRVEGEFAVYGSSGVVGSHAAALVDGPAIVVGRKGNVGSVFWVTRDFWPIDTVYFIPSEQSDLWLYLSLPNAGFMNTDAGVPGLNRDFAYSRKLVYPPERLRALFNEEVGPMFAQRNTLEHYNQKLAQARDLLLPRLMSGELAV